MAAPTVVTIYQSSDVFVCTVAWLAVDGDQGPAAGTGVLDDTAIAHGLSGIPNDISSVVVECATNNGQTPFPLGLELKAITATTFTVGKRNTQALNKGTIRYTLRRLHHSGVAGS